MKKKKIVFVVDNNAADRASAEQILTDYYSVTALSSSDEMFETLEDFKPDLILISENLPRKSGFDALQRLQSNPLHADILVMLTAKSLNAGLEENGIKLGAVDFVLKPFSELVMLNRVKKHLHIDELVHERTVELIERTEQLKSLKSGIVFTMADIVENRDDSTGGHIDRTSVYMEVLTKAMLERGVYADEIREWDLELVTSSARLHDIGKIEIPDCILNKPGFLTNDEFDKMKTHSAAGEVIIDRAIARTGDEEFLYNAKIIATYHHERWNGTGYPYGMKETEIPLQARIMAIIDVYDALVSERSYKEALTHEKAMEIIMNESGKHFDPQIAEVFHDINEQIKDVKNKI
jgi:putative two-component system response regulator